MSNKTPKRHFYYSNVGMDEQTKQQLFEVAEHYHLKPSQIVRMLIKQEHQSINKKGVTNV